MMTLGGGLGLKKRGVSSFTMFNQEQFTEGFLWRIGQLDLTAAEVQKGTVNSGEGTGACYITTDPDYSPAVKPRALVAQDLATYNRYIGFPTETTTSLSFPLTMDVFILENLIVAAGKPVIIKSFSGRPAVVVLESCTLQPGGQMICRGAALISFWTENFLKESV